MANPLDVFSIVFNSDGLKEFEQKLKNNEKELDKYEKQTESLEQKLRELEAAEEKDAKAIAQTGKALQEAKEKTEFFKKSVTSMQESTQGKLLALRNNFTKLAKAVGSLAIVTTTIKKSLDFYEQGEQLEFLAEKTGLAVEKLQLLGNAAKKYGGTTEGIAGTVENLRSQYQDARMGNVSGGMKNAYMKYGFQISSDPEQTLQRLAQRMETMKSDTAKWDLAKSLGIDEGTTRLLIQGQAKYNEELKKASKYKLYTKEDIQRMRDYRQISGDIRMGIESIFGSIARMLLPAITAVAKVVRNVTDWLSEYEGAVKIVATVTAIGAALLALKPIITAIGAVIGFFTPEIVAAIVIITALVAVIQDFIVFLQGGDSIIGGLLEKWGVNVNKWRDICLTAIENVKRDLARFIDWFKDRGEEIAEWWKYYAPDWLSNLFERGGATYTLLKKGGEQIVKYNESKLNAVPTGALANANQTQAIMTNNNNNTRTLQTFSDKRYNYGGITFNITSDNPKEAAREIQQAIYDIDNGRMT